MSALPLHPLGIYIFGLAGGFALPLLYQIGARWLAAGFWIAFAGLTACAVIPAIPVLLTGQGIEIATAGATSPLSISLRFGLWEAAVSASATLTAALLALALWPRMRGQYVPLVLFLLATMGMNGLVQTRDLFNQFVFLEILSVATYGLLAMGVTRAAVQAAFKYVVATMVASALVLLGTVLLYDLTGHLDIDLLIATAPPLGAGSLGIALALVLAGYMVELKPYPAGGWGLDVYETAAPPLAAFLSVVGSAGLVFALGKLIGLYDGALPVLVWAMALTFVASNLAMLRQASVFRMFGYSSIGQIGLLMLALVVLRQGGAPEVMPLILFGLFVNHLLAKAGLFCLAGALRADGTDTPLALARRPGLALLLGIFVVAIVGLPPFPGFWAKWALVQHLAETGRAPLIAAVLLGTFFEALALFRWFFRTLDAPASEAETSDAPAPLTACDRIPVLAFAALLLAAGAAGAAASGALGLPLLLPLVAGAALYLIEPLPGRLKAVAMLAVVLAGSTLLPAPDGIPGLFAPLLLAGGVVIAAAGLAWPAARRGQYPLLALLLLSIQCLLVAETGLAFYIAWELVALSATFLIARTQVARPDALRYLAFSLAAAYCLMAGFSLIAADTGTDALRAVGTLGPESRPGVALLAAGFMIKVAAIGVHVWLPAAHGAAPEELSALLSGVITKTAVFGLFMTGYLVLQSTLAVDYARGLAWIGMTTTLLGAVMALQQTDLKRLLAYSSMSQLGYIVTAIALMGHLGWVTAIYLVASHMMIKGTLFLAVAGVKLRTGRSDIAGLGGLLTAMPVTALLVGTALLSMSGLPPLTGFGAKWLLLAALMEKGWTEIVVAGALATFLGLWYMARLFAALFLGPRADPAPVRELPVFLLLPQTLLVAGILVLSLFPKLLMGPVSDAIRPDFAATLVWQGQSLETIYGLWDPSPVMLGALSVASVLALVRWGWARGGDTRPVPGRAGLLSGAPVPAALSAPVALMFWTGVAAGAGRLADRMRGLYDGHAQTYLVQVLLYFLVLAALLAALGPTV